MLKRTYIKTKKPQKETGLTRDGYYQFGIRKTFTITLPAAWELLFDEKGLRVWLGCTDPGSLYSGKTVLCANGTEVQVSTLKPL